MAHPAYDVLEEDFVSEYGATTTLYKHKKSGAEILSVQIDDDNKVRFFVSAVFFRNNRKHSCGLQQDSIPEILTRSAWIL